MNRTHPLLAVFGIAFHGGMIFVLPLIVGFIASMVLDVSEVADTALGLGIGAAIIVGPVFLAMVAGISAKVLQELAFLRKQGPVDILTFIDTVHRHLAIITWQGYGVLLTGVVFILLSLGFKWASLGVLAVVSLVLFYWIAGASVFLSAFMVHTFAWGLGRRQSGIRREMSPAVVQTGEAVEERFHLTKVPIFPGYRLVVHDKLPERLDTESRYLATPSAARETVTLAGLLRATPRGKYRVGPAQIQYLDALGLTRVAVASLATAELTVLPRVRPVRLIEAPRSVDEEPDVLTVRHRFANEDYYRFRNYVSGDDTRRIHWKLSMRAGRLQVRLPESKEISHRRILVALDTCLTGVTMKTQPVLGNLLDNLVEAWVSLVDEMVRDGEQVTLMTAVPGENGPEVESLRCRKSAGSPWLELGARVRWQNRIDLAQLFADADDETDDLIVLSSRIAGAPPASLPGKRVSWIYLFAEDVLDPDPPGWFDRWAGDGGKGVLSLAKRSLLLPHPAGSVLNGGFRRFVDYGRVLNRDKNLRIARRAAVHSSKRVFAMLMGRPDAVYRMDVGPRHYVIRGAKGLAASSSAHGRGVA